MSSQLLPQTPATGYLDSAPVNSDPLKLYTPNKLLKNTFSWAWCLITVMGSNEYRGLQGSLALFSPKDHQPFLVRGTLVLILIFQNRSPVQRQTLALGPVPPGASLLVGGPCNAFFLCGTLPPPGAWQLSLMCSGGAASACSP